MVRTIVLNIEPITESDTNEQLHWISQTLGLFNTRDSEKSCHRIFIQLIKARKDNSLLSCQDLADNSHLSRATVLHHLDKLMESNLVIEENHKFTLLDPNLNSIIIRLKKEMNEYMDEMINISKKLDEELGF